MLFNFLLFSLNTKSNRKNDIFDRIRGYKFSQINIYSQNKHKFKTPITQLYNIILTKEAEKSSTKINYPKHNNLLNDNAAITRGIIVIL